jgi:dTDP-4-amino-4,6-dideoxygalactose transaminase
MDWKVPLADLDFGEEEEAAVLKVLRSRWLTMGETTVDFEGSFASFLGVKHAFALSNATEALHLACLALGIGPGDEVIVPSLTFVATANAVLYTGAEVKFTDILGPHDLTISPQEIEKQISPKTRAIMVMHYGGFPCQMESIKRIAESRSLLIIEDNAHAPGASLNGVALGTWGDVGCFSFFSNKNLAVGEGGMLVTNRDDVAEKVRYLRSHGMTTLTWDRHKGHAYTYDVIALGYNYRIDEMRSALGVVQLKKLVSNNTRREQLTKNYREALSNTGIGMPFCEAIGKPAYHIFPILLPQDLDRKSFIDKMKERRIQTSIHYPPIHTFDYYRKRYPGVSLVQTEAVAKQEVTLPLYPTMNEQDVKLVVSAVQESLL